MLIPVPEDLSASALALVEPWACVENSYVEKQRQTLKDGGQMLGGRRDAGGQEPRAETAAANPGTLPSSPPTKSPN